ncbi:trichohyalin-like isoform X2 [Leptopilina heterotoma]|nr:trichohyalin-like isoform X2 [Leptopilina heterotoma]
MWSASEEPPGPMEGGPPEEPGGDDDNNKESCEKDKSQLDSLKDIMLRNKQSLRKKEEEIQEYAKKLTKFKTRAKLSKRNRDDTSGESTPKSISEASISEPLDDEVDDISQAKTPKAKSSLLQRKLAEDKKIFEQRRSEITESKRAVEEKVEAIRQQLEEREQQLPITPVVLSQGAAPLIQMSFQQDKDNKIAELSNRILELEATVLDLRENLREKDSVIDSKTKAVTLMSADLSLKGKTTLDTLEDTKDEMRTMQEHFILLETSLRSKNDNLLEQLEEKTNKTVELEETLNRLQDQLRNQKLSESAINDFSRSTMNTLADTKEEMKSMQENFILVETSLKTKNEHLLQQLEARETKLAEAKETIFKLESGLGITRSPDIDDFEYKLSKLEENNRRLQDEKYELQKDNVELQNKVITLQSTNGNGVIVEKDNRIAELENLIEELKKSNQLLEEESKVELEKQVNELMTKNEEISNKVVDLEKIVHDLESEKNDLVAKIPSESKKADEKVVKLTKEMEEMNKGLLKIKAQHKSKVKNLQRQLESFRKVSDVNAELVRLGNQVAVLEEEKGNLQLSLVDFDELKASAGEWKEQISDLEGKVNAQAKEIQGHIDAIAALENQKLDLMQEIHAVKQEVSALEEENAESENLRVTAEMKIVDLEEQLEAQNKIIQNDSKQTDIFAELTTKIETLTKENEELQQKIAKGTSDSGSTESFETLQETDRSELLKKIEEISQRNNDLLKKLSTLEEKTDSNVGSTDSFEAINEHDRNDLMKRIDALTRENNDLVIKLSKIEEKGSSDTGSTESFEKIPEHSDSSIKIEMLTRENNNLVIKLTKLEEKLADGSLEELRKLEAERNELSAEVEKLKTSVSLSETVVESEKTGAGTAETELEIETLRKLIEEQTERIEEMNIRLTEKDEELREKLLEVDRLVQLVEQKEELEGLVKKLKEELENTISTFEEKLEAEGQSLMAKDKEIVALKEKIKIKEKDLMDKYAQLQNEMITIDSLQDELEQRKHDLQQKDTVIVSLTEEVNDLKVSRKWEITTAKKHIEELKNQLIVMKSPEEFEHVLQEMRARVLEVTDLENKLQEQTEKIKELEAQIESAQAWANQRSEIEGNLRTEIEETKLQSGEQINYLQSMLDSNAKYAEELKSELDQVYQQVERLKVKHVEEMDMQNRRLEEIIEDLQNKVLETENLKGELEMSKKINTEGENPQGELEAKISDLEQQLGESSQKSQKQLEKMKKLVANLKKKSALCEELETRVKELEEELSGEKSLKEALNQEIKEKDSLLQDKDSLILEKNSLILEKDKNLEEKEAILQDKESLILEKDKNLEEKDSLLLEKDKNLEEKVSLLQNKDSLILEKDQDLEEKETILQQQASELIRKERLLEEAMAELLLEKNKSEGILEEKTKTQEILSANEEMLLAREEILRGLENQVTFLENKVLEVENDQQEGYKTTERLGFELEEARGRLLLLMRTIDDGEDSFDSLLEKCKRQQIELVEAKDNVRELSVRMQVMEAEYVDQLSIIQSLKTENGMLSSRYSQINERLENAEKESEERKILLEERKIRLDTLERENEERKVLLDTLESENKQKTQELELENERRNQLENLEVLAEERRKRLENLETEAEERKAILERLQIDLEKKEAEVVDLLAKGQAGDHQVHSGYKCERCEQCQTLVHTLEARLQERDAQIENLDNELANSVVNFVQMQDNIRINNLGQNRSLQESYNDLMMQYNGLSSANEEMKLQLTATLAENQELLQKIQALQELNISLEERTQAVEIELASEKLAAESLRSELESSQSSIRKNSEEPDSEVGKVKREAAPLFDASKVFGASSDQSELARLREIVAEKEKVVQELSGEFEKCLARCSEMERLANERLSKLEDLENRKQVEENQGKELEALRTEKEEIRAEHELCRFRIIQLENEIKNCDAGRVIEVEERVGKIQRDNELFQLQVNDLQRALEDAKESTVPVRSLQEVQAELKIALQERDQLLLQVENLTHALKSEKTPEDETASKDLLETLSKVAAASETLEVPTETPRDESAWEVEEEGWGFPAETTAELLPLTPNVELRLETRIAELEDQLRVLETEKSKILEDNSNISAKCGKLIKKLKEYKVQVDNLQQQLKSRKLTSDMCDLDSMFSDEINSQIFTLEKTLSEAREEVKTTLKEKENLTNRLDVLMAANEQHVELKEKQDMEMQVLELRLREMAQKLENSQKMETGDEELKEMVKQLQEKTTALDVENQELQAALYQQKTNRLALETKLAKLAVDEATTSEVKKLSDDNLQLEKNLEKVKEEYSVLRKQYEQSLMDANDQVQAMRQNSDLLKEEVARRKEEFDTELENMRRDSEQKSSSLSESVQQKEQEILQKTQEIRELREEIVQLGEMTEKLSESLKENERLNLLLDEKIQRENENAEIVSILENNFQTQTASVQSLQENVQKLQNEIAELKKLLGEKSTEILHLQEEVQKLQEELEGKSRENWELGQKLSVDEKEIERLEDDKTECHDNLRIELEAKRQELQAKEIELESLRKIISDNELLLSEFETEKNKQQEELLRLQEEQSNFEEKAKEFVEKAKEFEVKEREFEEKFLSDRKHYEEKFLKRNEEFREELQEKLVDNEEHLLRMFAMQEQELRAEILEKEEEVQRMIAEKEEELGRKITEKEEELRQKLFEKEEEHRQKLFEKEEELKQKIAQADDLTDKNRKDSENLRKTADEVPMFRMGGDEEIDQLKAQLTQKQLQVEHLEASLNLNTYTQIIQELQDTVNQLYNEKTHFEMTLATFSQNLKEQVSEKEVEIKNLRQELEVQRQEAKVQKEEVSPRMSRRKRSLDEEENQRLRDALRAWEQEVQDLRQILAEKDAQLMEDSSGGDKMMIERLMSEKEQMRIESQENLERMLTEKQIQIEEVRSRLEAENESLLNDLKLRERDIENLRRQIEEIDSSHDEQLQKKIAEIAYAGNDLAERDRRLAEMSVTKDAEIQNLKLQIHDKELRIEELQALSDEEERQLTDLKMILETRDHEVSELKQQYEEKLKELELIQHALRRHVTNAEDSEGTSLDSSANELDLALYMLHQRDMRCDELTLELMQLLEERDTLQLRLSNAIRVNEEMRRSGGSPSKSLSMSAAGSLPLVEDPSPSRAEGPVEIAKDALDSSIGEDKEALAQKLSQLHTVGHSKDVRLRDDRELRHTQQMSLLAHKDVLSTLPPEAAARLINANYTLSRDVQSQSSVLMNWLWGKSTPKVMHM